LILHSLEACDLVSWNPIE